MAAFMKLGDIKGEFAPSRKSLGGSSYSPWDHEVINASDFAEATKDPGWWTVDGADFRGIQQDALTKGGQEGEEVAVNDVPPVFKKGSNWDVICDIGTSIKQTSVADDLINYRPEGFAEVEIHFVQSVDNDHDPAAQLRSDNRFVFEPLNAMNSFGDSFDPGLDGANGFKPREVSAVQIGRPPEPKLWLQMLG